MYNPFDVMASNGGFGENQKVEIDKFVPKREYREPQLFKMKPSQNKSGQISGWHESSTGGKNRDKLTGLDDPEALRGGLGRYNGNGQGGKNGD